MSASTDWDVSVALSGRGAERRKAHRFEVTLRGSLTCKGRTVAVEIGDISSSGAFVFVQDPPGVGQVVVLSIEKFGAVEMIVMHAGNHFCGLKMTEREVQGKNLVEWALQQPAMSPSHPWSSAPSTQS